MSNNGKSKERAIAESEALNLPPLVPLSRGEFFARIGMLNEVDKLVDEAFRFDEEQSQFESDKGHGRDDDWHVSFHGSSFPGDDANACPRAALYRMLDFPRGMVSRRGRHFMEAGKAYEESIVWRFYRSGMLLSPPPNVSQLQFEDPDHWLTCTTDALVVKPRSRHPYVIEIKLVFDKTVDAMRRLLRGPDDNYVRQVKCEIGMAHETGPIEVKRCHNTDRLGIRVVDPDRKYEIEEYMALPVVCAQHGHADCLVDTVLEPVNHGYLFYANRDDMIDTRSYYFDYDPRFMEEGRAKLAQWRQWFLEDKLPQTVFGTGRYPHPFGWQWTKPEYPCKWCDFGDICRKDNKTAIEKGEPINLGDTSGVEENGMLRPDYDYNAVRERVLARWGMVESKTR